MTFQLIPSQLITYQLIQNTIIPLIFQILSVILSLDIDSCLKLKKTVKGVFYGILSLFLWNNSAGWHYLLRPNQMGQLEKIKETKE